jgi:aminomethyltransferase
VPFAGYEMPVSYSGVLEEHRAVRTAAGLFDVSHMGEIHVRGAGAEAFLQSLTPNDLRGLTVGRAHLNALLNERGGMIDDMLVYRLAQQEYLLVVNAGAYEHTRPWIERWAREWRGLGALELEDRSAQTAMLALQGPRAEELLAPTCDADLKALRYYRCVQGRVHDVPALISRTGYTGEDGFELYVANAQVVALWDRILEDSGAAAVSPVGLGARDTLRLEAGMLLSGQDFDAETTPFEVGLDWMVKLGKGDFLGRDALQEQLAAGVPRRLVGFRSQERAIARHGCKVRLRSGQLEGTVTSGTYSPTLECPIGLAMIDGATPADVTPGTPLELEVRGRQLAGEVVRLPFYRRC